jgi:hypothetical protein
MEFKSFAIGAVVGGVVVAGATALIMERGTEPQPNDVATPREAIPLDDEGSASASLESPQPSAIIESESPSSFDEPARAAEAAVPEGQANIEQDWFTAKRQQLAEEPREISWSYFVEQAMSQFLTDHPAMSQFGVEYIECRTRTCQIGTEAYTEMAEPDWQRVLYDLRQQPWYEFGQVGTSSGLVNGRRMIITELQRQPNE